MFLRLKRGMLKRIVEMGFKKAGNIRKLEKKIGISRSTLSDYHLENRLIIDRNLENLKQFINIQIKDKDIIEKLPDNWKQIRGGKNCVRIKKEKGIYEKQMKLCHKGSSEYMKNLHKTMKNKEPKKYYLSQYEKFKKIAEYKYLTNNKEKVRNKLEKDVADILKRFNIEYEYEPYVNINGKAFFPDFLINKKVIVECTAWRGYDKAIKLKEKIRLLGKYYKVYVVIPKALYNYYKTLNHHLVLGLDEFVPLAQSGRASDCYRHK